MTATENTEAMRRARRADSERKRRLVLAATDAQLEAGRHPTRLSRAEGARLVADELLPEGVLTELADQQLAGRVAELDQQLFQPREDLRRTTEELEAARAINRELMQQGNRSAHSRST
jgi:hypothetical protein